MSRKRHRRAGTSGYATMDPLEPRRLLSAGMGQWRELLPSGGNGAALPAVQQPAAPLALGQVLSGQTRQLNGDLTRVQPDKRYHFTLRETTALQLSGALAGRSDAPLMQITDAAGRTRAVGESISRTLPAGQYTLRVMHPTPNRILGADRFNVTLNASWLAPPTRLEADVWGGGAVRLNWLDNTPFEMGYRVQMFDKATQTWERVGMAGRNHTAAVVTGLTSGEGYSFRVQAISQSNAGHWHAAGGATIIHAFTESTDTRRLLQSH